MTVVVLGFGAGPAGESTLASVLAQGRGASALTVAADGPAAMNRAARSLPGEGLALFLRPGDRLAAPDGLATALRDLPVPLPDAVVGHHLLCTAAGEELILAADPREALAQLRRGELDWQGIRRLPAAGAVLWSARRLREEPLREDLAQTAHHELLLRLAARGARLHHALAPLCASSQPEARPDSLRARAQVLREWRAFAPSCGVPASFDWAALEAEALRSELHRLGALELLRHAGRVPQALRELRRRVRARRLRAASPAALRPSAAPGDTSPALP